MPLNFSCLSNRFRSPLGNQRGVTLLVVLVMMVILGLAAGMAGTTWRTIMQQEREAELLFRGDQYRRALESYSANGAPPPDRRTTTPVANYPNKLEDLLRDPRFPGVRRHIRKLYKDPFTGEDFVVVKDQGGRIKGVRSASEDEPFKKDNFAKEYEAFKDAQSYQNWEFVFEPGKKGSTNSTGGTKIEGLDGVRDADGSMQSPSGSSSSRSPSSSPSGRSSRRGSSNPFR